MYIIYYILIYYFTCFSRRTAQAMDFVYQATRQRDDFFEETHGKFQAWSTHGDFTTAVMVESNESPDIDWHWLTWKIDSPCPSVQQFFPYKSSFSSENQGTAQFSLVKRASFCAFVCRFPDLVVPHRPCATCLLRRAAQRCLRRVASRVGGFGAAGAEGAAGPARERPGNGWILPQIRGLNHQEMMISQVKL